MAKGALSLATAYNFAEANGLSAAVREIRAMRVAPDLQKDRKNTVQKALVLDLLEAKGMLERFIAAHWRATADERRSKRAYYRFRQEKNERLLGALSPGRGSWRRT